MSQHSSGFLDGEPVWKASLAFRGQPYRLLHHQNGVAGYVSARVLGVCGLPEASLGRFSPSFVRSPGVYGSDFVPAVSLGLGRDWRRVSPEVMQQGARGEGWDGERRLAWGRDPARLEVVKESIAAGSGGALMEVQSYNRKDITALGTLDIEPLVVGQTSLLDVWVELQPHGRVHLLVDYEPRGIAPQNGDVVFLESFARWPRSVVLPPREPLVVVDTRHGYVMVAYDTPSGHRGMVCLHRNTVFVVERLSWWDRSIQLTSTPVDALLQTDAGQWAVRKCRPAVSSITVLAAPVAASARVALASASLAAGAVFHGTLAVAREHFK